MSDEGRTYQVRNMYGRIEHLTAQEIVNLWRRGENITLLDDPRSERLMMDYLSATDRPVGELVAGSGMLDGQPALYEQGGWHGDPDRIDVYRGPNGPLASPHSHRLSNDGGRSVDYSRDSDGTVRRNKHR